MNEVKAYHCDKCDGYYLKEEHYCRGDRKCEDCGVPLQLEWYYTVCSSCKNKREEDKLKEKFDKAQKLNLVEYQERFSNYPFFADYENNDFEADSLFDKIYEESGVKSTFFWGATKNKIGLDFDDIHTQLIEHDFAYDDYDIDEEAGEFIQNFVDEYNLKYAGESFNINFGVAVILPEEWQNE